MKMNSDDFTGDDVEARRERAKRILDRMPTLTREVFVLHKIAGLTYTQIAERLKISGKEVEKRLQRAFEMCASVGS
jgi:RNA polymerase sigma-70 factor (ECF subfamily)